MGVEQTKSGQTRAVLARMQRTGATCASLKREKRMGDLAWQMTVAEQKFCSCPHEKYRAKEFLQKLYDIAKAEYDRLNAEIEIENAPEVYGVYLG